MYLNPIFFLFNIPECTHFLYVLIRSQKFYSRICPLNAYISFVSREITVRCYLTISLVGYSWYYTLFTNEKGGVRHYTKQAKSHRHFFNRIIIKYRQPFKIGNGKISWDFALAMSTWSQNLFNIFRW